MDLSILRQRRHPWHLGLSGELEACHPLREVLLVQIAGPGRHRFHRCCSHLNCPFCRPFVSPALLHCKTGDPNLPFVRTSKKTKRQQIVERCHNCSSGTSCDATFKSICALVHARAPIG